MRQYLIGEGYVWLWIAIGQIATEWNTTEPTDNILQDNNGICMSVGSKMLLVAEEQFMQKLVIEQDKHFFFSGISGTLHPKACKSLTLELNYILHLRKRHYRNSNPICYSIECFDDYFLYRKTHVNQNVIHRLNVFVADICSEMIFSENG